MKKLQYERPFIQRLNTSVMNKFGSRSAETAFKSMDGNNVSNLIKEFGSPLFVISEKTIRKTMKDALRAFKTRYPKVQFAWSYKTNYINAVCNVFHQEGSWAEVVSGFEYRKAIKNNIPGNKIIFNGPDKKYDELKSAAQNNSLIHIDHLDELSQLSAIAVELQKKPRVGIRVNMNTGVFPLWDRFGFNYENGQALDAVARIMANENLELAGLHCHIGTFMISPGAYGVAATKLSDLALTIQNKYRKSIEYIDMGGGFASGNSLKGSFLQGNASPSFDQYAEAISSAILSAGFAESQLPLLILETGRALIDEAGYLLGTVISNKRLSDGRRATILDFGVNVLFTSFWYDHKISSAQDFKEYTEESVVYGPLCMNIDVIREHVILPPLNAGDHVVAHMVGAYNMTQWMQFISLRPAVVMIDMHEKAHLIRKREELRSIENEEVMPSYLKDFKL